MEKMQEDSRLFIRHHHLRTETPDASVFERHCHNYFELLYVAAGSGKAVVEGAEYPLIPGALFLFRPLEYHYVRPDHTTPYERYVINFGKDIPMEEAARFPLLQHGTDVRTGAFFPPGQNSESFAKIFPLLDLEEGLSDGAKRTLSRTVVTQVLLLLGKNELPSSEAEETLAARIVDYLNDNLATPLTLDEVAKRFFISKYYLCRVFRGSTGVSVMHFVNTKRVAFAKELIEKGVPATEAALEAGFHDYSVLYRACRKTTGRAPVAGRGQSKNT